MIGQMAVRVTADRANFPLGTLFVRRGSAANVALVGVPVRAGVDVESVAVRVENVDGATADFAARQFGGVWVVDIPASHFATVGSVTGGVAVYATGTGADGETARTWNIGIGDLEVLPADADAPAPTPGQAFWPLRMFDAAPTTPTKYNAYLDDGKLMVYNGEAWVEISGGSIDVDDAVTSAGVNPVKSSGIWGAIWGALTSLPSGFASLYDWCVAQLAGKRGKTDLAVYADAWSLLPAGASDRLVLLPTPQAGYWTDTGTLDGQNAIRFMGDGFYRLFLADGTRGVANDVPEGAEEITFLDADMESEVVAVATKQVAATADTLAKTSQIPTVPSAATDVPLIDGAANAGASANYARADHVHPTDITRAAAADLRYRIAEAAVRKTLPADCFPVTFTYEGVSYSVNSLVEQSEASAAGDMFIMVNENDYSLTVVESPATGSELMGAIEVATFDAGGVFETSGIQDLQFGGVSPVASTSPTLAHIQVLADRTVNLVTASDETSIDIELPAAVTVDGVRYARDFFLDVDNSADASDLALEFTGLGVDYAFVPLEDDCISEMTTIGAGERVRLYFTETPYTATGSLPVINVARVTLGDFVTSTTPQGGN